MASDNFIKRLLGTRKAGHSGTLDPFATGLLPVFVGDALKVMRYTDGYDKSYRCVAVLGMNTDTQDKDGVKTGGRMPVKEELEDLQRSDFAEVKRAFSEVSSRKTQMPPLYSAKKINGRKAYEIAREGGEAGLKPQEVDIKRLEIFDIRLTGGTFEVEFEVDCSKGTYVRTICEDAGNILGFGAYASSLRRLRCGPFLLKDAYTEETLSEMAKVGDMSFLRSRDEAFYDMPSYGLTSSQADDIRLGKKIPVPRDYRYEGDVLVRGMDGGRTVAVIYRKDDMIRIDRMLDNNGRKDG